jgi:tetratricopeptide (TPR) repeat protein
MSLTWLGAVHERLGAFETAISLREQAVAALKQARNRRQYAYASETLAEAYHRDGRISDAIDNYRQAQAFFRQIGDRRNEADVLSQLGNAQKTAGQSDAARQSWQQALAIFEELRDTRANQVRAKLGTEARKPVEPDRSARLEGK